MYTRNNACAPIRAEDGITGVNCCPKYKVAFRNLPIDLQIGGYPSIEQLSDLKISADELDSEGRCVILEFQAFVLLALYCPANRNECREEYRTEFLTVLDLRIRNLVKIGKRVIVMGDLNILAHIIDSAATVEAVKKNPETAEVFILNPCHQIFSGFVITDTNAMTDNDKNRSISPIMLDVCRLFHPAQRGMYTCWDQKLNTRPGNYGSRIDYILCSLGIEDWFLQSDVQKGLMVS